MCLLLALTPIWRTILYNSADFTKLRLQGSDAIFDCVIYGCVAAIFLHYDKVKYINAKSLYLSIAILVLSLAYRDEYFRATWRYSVQSLAVAVIILNISLRPNKILQNNILVYIGKISYPLYLCHFGTLITIEALGKKQALQGTDILYYFAFSFLLAAFAYHAIEKPLQKLRKSL